MKKFLIIEDHPMLSTAVKLLIEERFSPCEVYVSRIFAQAEELVAETQFDLIIMDIYVPGGGNTDMIKALRSKQKKQLILVSSGREEKTHAIPYIRAGANGFISKNATEDEMAEAIKTVLAGKKYFSKDLWEMVITNFTDQGTTKPNPTELLSKRERQVMELMLEGKWTKEIADFLDLKLTTVSTHKANIFQKMEVNSVIELFKKLEEYSR